MEYTACIKCLTSYMRSLKLFSEVDYNLAQRRLHIVLMQDPHSVDIIETHLYCKVSLFCGMFRETPLHLLVQGPTQESVDSK